MQVADAMTRGVKTIDPGQTIVEAARMMADSNIGSLPVAENDRLVGMVTDRDIVIRALAQGKSTDTSIREIMSGDIKYCFEDNDLDEVARNMGDIQMRRLAVVDRNKRLVGILSLGDLAETDESAAGDALTHISEAASQHHVSGQRPH